MRNTPLLWGGRGEEGVRLTVGVARIVGSRLEAQQHQRPVAGVLDGVRNAGRNQNGKRLPCTYCELPADSVLFVDKHSLRAEQNDQFDSFVVSVVASDSPGSHRRNVEVGPLSRFHQLAYQGLENLATGVCEDAESSGN